MKMGGEWRYGSTILKLSTRSRFVVSFTILQLYLLGQSQQLKKWRLGGPTAGLGVTEETKHLFLLEMLHSDH
jgi:hypothetical protein